MRVVVTGAAGFIGAEVVRALLAQGHDVIAVVREQSRAARLESLSGGARLVVRPIELSDPAAIRSLLHDEKPDALAHFAWYADPRDYLSSRENLSSLVMTNQLVAAAVNEGCRKLVLAGSCLEYAETSTAHVETDVALPSSLYASCKYASWLIARALCAPSGATLVWGRIFHLHGRREHPSRLIAWAAERLARDLPVELTGGEQVRDHLHVEDAAAAFTTLLTSGEADGVYNICSGEAVTLRHVLGMVGQLVGKAHLLRFGALPYRPNEVMVLCGDSTRLRKLGWRPRWSLVEGLAESLGIESNPSGHSPPGETIV